MLVQSQAEEKFPELVSDNIYWAKNLTDACVLELNTAVLPVGTSNKLLPKFFSSHPYISASLNPHQRNFCLQ